MLLVGRLEAITAGFTFGGSGRKRTWEWTIEKVLYIAGFQASVALCIIVIRSPADDVHVALISHSTRYYTPSSR
jgi:hypothetical protein